VKGHVIIVVETRTKDVLIIYVLTVISHYKVKVETESMGYWSQKAEDDLNNSDLFRECKLCNEFMEISKFDVKYRNYTSIGPLDYHYWECKECMKKKGAEMQRMYGDKT